MRSAGSVHIIDADGAARGADGAARDEGTLGVKARRVFLALREEIGAARGPGDVLPGEQRLAETFGVSRVTVRRALDALEQEGLIERHVGRGASVRASAEPERAVVLDLASLMPQLVRMGETSARLLSFHYAAVPAPVAAALGVESGLRVQVATRVRLANGVPFSHLTTHVPEAIAASYSENDLATMPLFRLLERSGVTIARAEQSVSATLAGPEAAEALEVAVGSPLLSLRRVVRDDGGRGVEHLAALYRPDLFQLEMSFARVGEDASRHWEPVIGSASEGPNGPTERAA